MSSGEYALLLDYLANVDPEQDGGQELLKQIGTPHDAIGMDMDATEGWAPPTMAKPSKRKAKMNAKKLAKAERRAKKEQRKAEIAAATPKRPSRPGTPSTPHSRQGSTSSTPMSWGKRDKRGLHARMASPLPLPQLRARYDLPFVAAIDPLSKLVDDDALIVVPHDKAMAEAFAATDHQHIAVEIFVDATPVHIIDSPSPMVCDESTGHMAHVEMMDVTIEQLMMGESDEEDSEEDSMENEESYEDDGDEDEGLEGSQEEHSEEDEEGEEGVEGSSEMDDSLEEDSEDYLVDSDDSDDDGLSSTDSFDSSSMSDDLNMDSDEDDSDSDAGSDDEMNSGAKRSNSNKTQRFPTSSSPNVSIPGRNGRNEDALLRSGMVTREGVQLKHDTRRRKKRLSPYSRQEPEQGSGSFPSQKKLSKAEKKKQKQRNRDEKPLELHELQTWNGLIRDFIEHTPAGTTMPFSPMGRFQRKQLHWLSEFYGLRSQSYGSGTRRMTHVFVTKRTSVPELAVSLAACRAIHEGRHPFTVSSAELEQSIIEASRITSSKKSRGGASRETERSGGRAARNKKGAAGKARSPLLRTSQSSQSGKHANKKQRRQQERQTRRSRMDFEDEEDEQHHGLDFSANSNTKRLVGAGAAHIPESNLGHLMLRKLGWANGGLGKEEQGISHPIQAIIKDGRRGLGS